MGVEIQLGAMVTDVDRNGLTVKYKDGSIRRIESATKVWSAGVAASPLGRDLAAQSGVELDRAGRVKVLPDLTVPGHPNVWVVGDMMAVDGVPGQAQGAIQGGKYAANLIKAELKGADPATREPFKYFDKGSMATVSKYSGGGQGRQARVRRLHRLAGLAVPAPDLSGRLPDQDRHHCCPGWSTFLGRSRGQLTITEQQAYARTRIEQLEGIAATVVEDDSDSRAAS